MVTGISTVADKVRISNRDCRFSTRAGLFTPMGPIYGWDHGILLSCCPDPCHPPVAYMRNAMLAECYTYR